MVRTGLVAGVIAATALPPGALAQAPAAPGQPAVADVIVLDAGGRPLTGLATGDFAVAIDGAPRRVTAAQPVIRVRTLVPSPVGAAAVAPADRLALVIVDEASIARGNEKSAVAATARLLDRIAPNERVALVRLPATASRLVVGPNGPAVQQSARAVIGRMPPPGLGAASLDAPTPLNDDADPTDERGNVRPLGAPVRAPQSPADRAAEIEALAGRVRQASASTLPEFVRLLESLKSLAGPKSVFYLSTGIAATAPTLRAVGAAAALARAQVHVVQLPPASWQREVFASQPAEAPSDEPSATANAPSRGLNHSGGLAALAAAAGGIFAPSEKKTDAQVDRLLTQVSAGYVLELERGDTDLAAEPQTISVTLTRPGGGVARVCPIWSAHPAATPSASATPAVPSPVSAPAPAGRRSASITRDPALLRALERIGEVVTGYVRDLSSVVAEERYEQATYRGTRTDKVRVLRSDFLLLKAQNGDGWTPFRDVFEVDGRPVRDREERLKKLFLEKPETALQEALRIKEESVRYLLGDGNTKSNVNWPTLALEFLLPSNQWRFDMRRGAEETVEGIRAWRIDYNETAIPTLILTYDRLNVPARGSFWVDPATGRVLKTTLQTGGRTLEMTITVVVPAQREPGTARPLRNARGILIPRLGLPGRQGHLQQLPPLPGLHRGTDQGSEVVERRRLTLDAQRSTAS